jgi:hypothetical protein
MKVIGYETFVAQRTGPRTNVVLGPVGSAACPALLHGQRQTLRRLLDQVCDLARL